MAGALSAVAIAVACDLVGPDPAFPLATALASPLAVPWTLRSFCSSYQTSLPFQNALAFDISNLMFKHFIS